VSEEQLTAAAAGPDALSGASVVQLPQPHTAGGMPLLDAISRRHSTRAFDPADLTLQEISDVLWVACGHNRPSAGVGIYVEGCRSSPTAHNWQEIDVYVATRHGLHRYEPAGHTLSRVLERDLRPLTGDETQPFVASAPLNLIYVSDLERMTDTIPWDYGVFPWANSAVLVENVYLYCASVGLATVCRALFDRPALTAAMELGPKQLVTLHQLVGHPAI
jgi:nitroreductase